MLVHIVSCVCMYASTRFYMSCVNLISNKNSSLFFRYYFLLLFISIQFLFYYCLSIAVCVCTSPFFHFNFSSKKKTHSNCSSFCFISGTNRLKNLKINERNNNYNGSGHNKLSTIVLSLYAFSSIFWTFPLKRFAFSLYLCKPLPAYTNNETKRKKDCIFCHFHFNCTFAFSFFFY